MRTKYNKITFSNDFLPLLKLCLQSTQLGVELQTATVVVVCAFKYSKVVLITTYPGHNDQQLHLYIVSMNLQDRHLRSLWVQQ